MALVTYSAADLAPSERMKLVETLLLCPSMNDTRAKRDTILRMLPEINRVAPRQDDTLTDVVNILQTCLQYSGAVHRLLAAIYGFDRAMKDFPIVARAFGETLGEICGPLLNDLTDTHLEKLERILKGVEFDWAGVRAAFESIMPSSEAPDHKDQTRNFAIMLWMAATQLRLEPIIRFAQALGDLNPKVRPGITEWLDQLVQDIPDAAAVVNTPAPVSQLLIEQPCLQIALMCSAREVSHDTPVRLMAVLRLNDKHHDDYPPVDTNMEKIAADIQELAEQSRRRVQPHQITVEVFLPLPLLKGYAVERWSFSDGLGDSSWGNDYPMVVRSFDRIKARARQKVDKDWKDKWNHLAELGQGSSDQRPIISDDNMVWICSCLPADMSTHSAKMKPSTTVGAAVLVNFERIPRVIYDQQPHEFINYLLLRGVPMAFWLRSDLPEAEVAAAEAAFRQLVQTTPPRELAAILRDRRKDALTKDSIWWQIAFLWDDPNTIPEAFTPEASGTESKRNVS
jgi:hypothetical protein